MHKLFLLLTVISFGPLVNAQDALSETDLLGTWTANHIESKSKGTKAMLKGSTITLESDYTFSAKIMADLKGKWSLDNGSVVLDSPDTPGPIIWTELTKDSCVWNADGFKARIVFYKNSMDNTSSSSNESIALVPVHKKNLVGLWNNTIIEDMSRSKEQNVFLFGEQNDALLDLQASGQFTLSKSSNHSVTNRMLRGNWSVDNGTIIFEDESGQSERLGITKCTQDSLVMIDMQIRNTSLLNDTKFKFVYTRKIE